MDLTKTELLAKCAELGLTKYKSKNKSELIKLIELLKNNKDKINWGSLSNNQAAIELLKEKINNKNNDDEIDWIILSSNKNAIELLKDNFLKEIKLIGLHYQKIVVYL